MSQTLTAPATIAPGSIIYLADGTTATIASDSTVSVPNNDVSALLDAGFTYAAASNSQTSQAASQATSAGLADSVSRSDATSAGLADSQTRSQASSTGLSNSIARSAITSGSV